MDDQRWDDLTRSLARGVSRRTVLKGLIGAAISGVLARSETQMAVAGSSNSNSACAKWCAAVFGAGTAAAGKCTSDAAKGGGLCKSCGASVAPASVCCTRTAQGYCSSYGGATCCATGSGCCDATCTALDTTSNCGACGHACPPPANGTATCSENAAGQYQCGSTCNPGACSIGGACYAAGAVNPANMCQHCDPASSTTAWTALVCAAPDQCQQAGVCNPATGHCTYAAQPNGTICDDGNACTQTDTCQDGVCVGGNPVVCTALDACHVAGDCDPATGQCSNPNAPDGTSCNDDNACTSGDTCQAGQCVGGTPTTCTPGPCQTGGTCDPATGDCSFTNLPDGTLCGADDVCTHDICQAGECVTNVPKANGTACSDNSSCTAGDACRDGVCVSGEPVTCPPGDVCHAAGTCDPTTGICSVPTLLPGYCFVGGVCIPAGAADPENACRTCNPALDTSSYSNAADGSACNDGNLCTQTDTCQNGVCVGGNPVVCTASDQCHVAGVCDPATGLCSNPDAADGTTCDDGNPCTTGDICQAGVCVGTPVVCSTLDPCHSNGACDPHSGACVYTTLPNGTPCDDGNRVCLDGICTGAEVDLQTDPNNCGALGSVCGSTNATAACVDGVCEITCDRGFANCDNNAANGCETNVYTDPNNCGRCGRVCGAGQVCWFGNCMDPCPAGYYATYSQLLVPTCKECPSGYYCPGGASPAVPCPAGAYNPDSGSSDSSACTPCPAGAANDMPGSTNCRACYQGSYSVGEGNTSCTLCPEGTTSVVRATSSESCTACPAGTYNYRYTDASECWLCRPGSYSAGEGNLTCTSCAPGTSNAGGGTSIDSCTVCPAGTFSYYDGYSWLCSPCAPGTYSDASGSSTCTMCPPGAYASGYGNSGCTPCAAGTYANASGADSCAACPAGFWAPDGATVCTTCGACGQCYTCDPTRGCVVSGIFTGCDSGHGTCGDFCDNGTCRSSGDPCLCPPGQSQCGATCCPNGCCQTSVLGGLVNTRICSGCV